MKNLLYILLILTVTSCGLFYKSKNKNFHNYLNIPDTLSPNYELVLNEYIDTLKNDLNAKRSTIFLKNSCLDYEEIGYCFINPHEWRSFRKDLFNKFTDSMIIDIKKYNDTLAMNLICDSNEFEIPYINYSNWDLIKLSR